MDVEITPEPSEDERQAILEALRAESEARCSPTPWRQAALDPGGEAYATAPRRQSRGATRA